MPRPVLATAADVDAIAARPGAGWAPAERDKCRAWLHQPGQLARLLAIARTTLGPGRSAKAEEDAWQDFASNKRKTDGEDAVESLENAMRTYDPARQIQRLPPREKLFSWVGVKFRTYCWHERDRYRMRESLAWDGDDVMQDAADE